MSQADIDAINAHTDAKIAALDTKLFTFLTAMLRGDVVGVDIHDNESVEGAVRAGKDAQVAATAAGATAAQNGQKLDQLAVQVSQILNAGGGDTASFVTAVKGLLQQTFVPSVPGNLQPPP